jgi:hypothetical protein
MKVCSKCKIEKDESEFYIQKGCKGGLRPDCKECHNARSHEYYSINKEEINKKNYQRDLLDNRVRANKRSKEWRSRNRELAIIRKNISISKKPEYYKQLYQKNQKAGTSQLKEWYIIHLLHQQGVTDHEINLTPDIVSIKRAEIAIKRLDKQILKSKNEQP